MDHTLPQLASSLLDLIASTEGPQGYVTIFGNNQRKLPRPITTMTIDEVIAAQRGWTKSYGSSAAGRYQCMRATLQGLLADPASGFRGSDVYNANCQDRIGFALLRRRGYDSFVAGRLSVTAFGLRLAQEWASLPVLADCQGAHRRVRRGETFYAGDKLNKVGMKPERVESALALKNSISANRLAPPVALEPAQAPAPAPRPAPVAPQPVPPSKPVSNGLFHGLLSMLQRG